MKKRIKKVIAYLLILSMTIFPPYTVYGADGNMEGGGGNTEQAESSNSWNIDDEAVRITVVDRITNTAVTESIDFTNVTKDYTHIRHTSGKNKIDYKNGANLSVERNGYQKVDVDNPIPKIISVDGNSNISAVKEYFCSEGSLKFIADKMHYDYDKLISGEVTLMIEPVAYFNFGGVKYAFTATETAMFDTMTKGKLRSVLGNLTHKNLPLAMFLEYDDIGFKAWTGTTSGFVNNSQIKSSLGIGTVNFGDGSIKPPNPSPSGTRTIDTHTNTNIYLSVEVTANKDGISKYLGQSASVSFNVDGKTLTSDKFVIPPHSKELVFVKYKTPSKAQQITVNITATPNITLKENQIILNVTKLTEKEPPDTNGEDKPPRKGWQPMTVSSIPLYPNQRTQAFWTQWKTVEENKMTVTAKIEKEKVKEGGYWDTCYSCGGTGQNGDSSCDTCGGGGDVWVDKYVMKDKIVNLNENKTWAESKIKNKIGNKKHAMVWTDGALIKDDFDNEFQEGEWKYVTYDEVKYDVHLSGAYKVYPDVSVYTEWEIDKRNSYYGMKSGYGVNVEVKPTITGSGAKEFCTNAQNVNSTFPEFDYKTYNRLLQRGNGIFRFKTNRHAINLNTDKRGYEYEERIHFTPVWFPDNKDYYIHFDMLDCWTPVGELRLSSGSQSPKILIKGSLFDDWVIVGERGK